MKEVDVFWQFLGSVLVSGFSSPVTAIAVSRASEIEPEERTLCNRRIKKYEAKLSVKHEKHMPEHCT